MLTNRQKKFLQKLAMNMDPVVQIGKNGLEDRECAQGHYQARTDQS